MKQLMVAPAPNLIQTISLQSFSIYLNNTRTEMPPPPPADNLLHCFRFKWLKNLTKKGLQFCPKISTYFFYSDWHNHLFFILLSSIKTQKFALFSNFGTFEMVFILPSKANCNNKKEIFRLCITKSGRLAYALMLVTINSYYVSLV